MEKYTKIVNFKCAWCEEIYEEISLAVECFDAHVNDYTAKGHPYKVGSKLRNQWKRNRYPEEDCIVVKVRGELNDTDYLLEFSDGERIWKRWWDLSLMINYKNFNKWNKIFNGNLEKV